MEKAKLSGIFKKKILMHSYMHSKQKQIINSHVFNMHLNKKQIIG